MTKHPFKVGDRVVCVRDDGSLVATAVVEGIQYTVIEIQTSKWHNLVRVTPADPCDGTHRSWWLLAERFEKVEET